MSTIVNICLLVLLGIVAAQDFKSREISWYLIPLLFIAFLSKGIALTSVKEISTLFLINFCFVVFILLVLTIYISLKKQQLTNIINSYIGLGDVLFFFALCAAFSFVNFIAFYIGSTLFSLIAFLAYNAISKKASKEIPLAGIMAGLLILLIAINHFATNLNFYSDIFIPR